MLIEYVKNSPGKPGCFVVKICIKRFDTGQLKEYTKSVVFNEKVFRKLEDYSK